MYIIVRLVLWCLPILYMGFIWWQSSNFNPESVYGLSYLVGPTIVLIIGICLEFAHLFEFGLLYLVLLMALLTTGPLTKKKVNTALIISLLYGVIDEIHQYYVPYRSTSIIDLIKNTIGIVVISYVINKYYYRRQNSKISKLLKNITIYTAKNKEGINL